MDINKLTKFLVVVSGIVGLFVMVLVFRLVIADWNSTSRVSVKLAVAPVVAQDINVVANQPTFVESQPTDETLVQLGQMVVVTAVQSDTLAVEVEGLNNKSAFLVWTPETIWEAADTLQPTPIVPSESEQNIAPQPQMQPITPADIQVGDRLIVSIGGDFQVDAQQYVVNSVIRVR